jgi:hypothetical protein
MLKDDSGFGVVLDLETRLRSLLKEAHSKGMTSAQIEKTLRDELEYEVELAHPGRRVLFQVIDLGVKDDETVSMPVKSTRELFQDAIQL